MRRFCVALAIWTFGLVRASSAGDCATPAVIEAPVDGPVKSFEQVGNYEVILKSCQRKAAEPENAGFDGKALEGKALDGKALDEKPWGAERMVAIRSMTVENQDWLLMVDPERLTTRLERKSCWTCGDKPDPAFEQSRYARAVRDFAIKPGNKRPSGSSWLENAGLIHGANGKGVFVTGDLCPSHRQLDRSFLSDLEKDRGPQIGGAPVALSITGVWVHQHQEDFRWLRREKAAGRLSILWVNHSYRHPFERNLSNGENFILTPGLDPTDEILNVERLLIANGETPSVFFRFPGLISNEAWMTRLNDDHLIPVGADAWLAIGQKPHPGSIVLVHPNGNEPAGIAEFKRLENAGKLPNPFRALEEAP